MFDESEDVGTDLSESDEVMPCALGSNEPSLVNVLKGYQAAAAAV